MSDQQIHSASKYMTSNTVTYTTIRTTGYSVTEVDALSAETAAG